MTAPDLTILAEAIKKAEADLQTFRGIDDPEIKKLVEFSEVILVAAKAYGPMREALEVIKFRLSNGNLSPGELMREATFAGSLACAALNGEALGWQPIETAPKDGTLVLLFAPTRPHDGPQQVGCFLPPTDGGAGCWWIADGRYQDNPTHWQPLPAPPAALNPAGPA